MLKPIIIFVVLVVAGCDTSTTHTVTQSGEFTDGAANVPINEFLLLRGNNAFAALRFIEPITNGDGGFKYECYYSENGDGRFTPKSSHKVIGKVFEKYKRTPDKKEPDTYNVENDGGQLLINCGDISVEWSLSTWVYLRGKNHPSGYTEIAFTNTANIEQINYLSKALKWHTKN